MNHRHMIDPVLQEELQSRELIVMLKGVIWEQQNKIVELETDLKKWQKKYKEDFFKDNQSTVKNSSEKLKQLQSHIKTFSRELCSLQQKYDQKASRTSHSNHEAAFGRALKTIQKLYIDLEIQSKELAVKIGQLQQKQTVIEKMKMQMQEYLEEYATTIRKSEEYEDKLLAEIKRQQVVIDRLKQ